MDLYGTYFKRVNLLFSFVQIFDEFFLLLYQPVSSIIDTVQLLLNSSLSVREVYCLMPGPVKSETVSPTACYQCDVCSKLCCPGAKPQRWIATLVTCFVVIQRA